MSKLTLAESIIDELRQAADRLTAAPHCGGVYSDCACDAAEELAKLFRDLADNPVDVPASVLDMAVRINRAQVARDEDRVDVEKTKLGLADVGGYPLGRAAGQARVSSDRIEEILADLNGFVEYGPGFVEYKLDKAIDWAKSQPDVTAAYGPLLGEANVLLADGTVLEWRSDEKRWAVTVSDECDTSEVTR